MSRVALVTGGGRGIGAAIAVSLAASGMDVAIASLEAEEDASDVLATIRGLGRTARYIRIDLQDLDRHASLVAEVLANLGPIDCLVNNAGVTSLKRGSILDLTPESFDRTLGINLRAAFFLTQRVAKHMTSCATGAYRSIVSISSVNAEIVGPDRADYCISKAGMSMMSRLFAVELAAHGVQAFEVRPGIIRTAMTQPATAKYDAFIATGGVPMRRWGTPEDVGRTVAALAQGELAFATGEVINVGGGLHIHRL